MANNNKLMLLALKDLLITKHAKLCLFNDMLPFGETFARRGQLDFCPLPKDSDIWPISQVLMQILPKSVLKDGLGSAASLCLFFLPGCKQPASKQNKGKPSQSRFKT